MRMRMLLAVVAACTIAAAGTSARQMTKADDHVGSWAGTWDGAGSGDFELTIDKTREGKATGRVAVTTEGGNYTADLTAIAFNGTKMTGKYDFPLDAGSEVILAATFEGTAAKGTWSLRPKGQETEVAGGTWTVKKK
jgi:hypothetical protein